jgi:hypothetical protein
VRSQVTQPGWMSTARQYQQANKQERKEAIFFPAHSLS